VAMVTPPPEAFWVLFAVAPDVAETLAVLTLREASLGRTSPHFKNDNGKVSVCDFRNRVRVTSKGRKAYSL
jgi:hypothetical protein